jgi:hypothetical protein
MPLFSALAAPQRLLHSGSWHVGAAALAALFGALNCGGAPAASPVMPESPATEGAESAQSTTSTGAEAQAMNAKDDKAVPGDEAYDKVKGKDPSSLKALFEKGAAPAFPAATISEQDCWRTVSVVGNARRDYESLLKQCGASTGAVQYVRPAMGHLHHKHQRRDTFHVPIQGGLCYRFFGVGDATINDLDILIEQRGALVGDDKSRGPVAIIETDKAWCMDRDGVYDFMVQVHGEGQGQYIFGIWARKDTK